jgi:hypothetical protein
MRIVQIPFPGFYDSILTGYLDNVEEQFVENETERQDEDDPDYWQPEGLRLDAGEFAQIVFDCMDYGKAERFLARRWVEFFQAFVKDELEIDIPMKFESMISPREYNFTTDRVFVEISNENARKLYRLSRDKKHVELAATIKERCTSRSGFASFYSNDINEWVAKPFEDWDHNELYILLIALLPDEHRVTDCILDGMNYQSPTDFDEAFDVAMDWDKYQRMVEEKRDDLRARLDPDFVVPVRRCAYTKDMFA